MRVKSIWLKLLAVSLTLYLGVMAHRWWHYGSQTVVMLGTHRLVMSPAKCHDPEPGKMFGDDHAAGFYCGRGLEVSLTDNRLVVNAESYGALEPGDEIAIVNGEVRINGVRRPPGR
jgi:hypothetical protein